MGSIVIIDEASNWPGDIPTALAIKNGTKVMHQGEERPSWFYWWPKETAND